METTAKKKTGWGTLALIGLFFLTKFKYVLVALKFAKFSTVISMFISLGVYAVIFGWRFAVAIIYCLFIHEMGHLIAMKIKKIPASPAVFIPFVGAVISIKGEIKDAKTEAFIAYGGPLAGLLSIVPAVPLFFWTGDPLFALIIYLGAFLNLFNLLPVSPLDGGRIAAALSTHIWAFGLLVLLAWNIFMPSPILILILIIGAITWFSRLGEGKRMELNLELKEMRTAALATLQSYEQNKIPGTLKQLEEVTFDMLENKTNRLVEIKKEQQNLSNLPKHTFFQKMKNSRQIKKDVQERLIKKEVLRAETVFYSAFGDAFSNYNNPEDRKIAFLSIVNEPLQRAMKSQKEEIKDLEKENTKLKTYYQSDKATKLKWASLYIGLILVLTTILVQSTLLMEEISKALQ